MSEYREIKGTAVQSLAADTSTIKGQIWYDNVNGAFKLRGPISSATWATGGSTSRSFNGGGGLGGNTGAVIFAGSDGEPAPNPTSNQTETYDGSSWSSGPSYPVTSRDGAGTGTSGSGLGICGHPQINTCNEWTGSTWTGVPSNPTTMRANTAFGIFTAAVNCGGGVGVSETTTTATQEFDGSGWTNSNNMNTGRKNAGGCGTQTLGLIAGGSGTPAPEPTQGNNVEEYDGTSWSTSNNLNNLRNSEAGMTGAQTSAVIYGGQHPTGSPNATEEYDGTSWSVLPGVTLPITGGQHIQGNGSTSQPTAFYVRGGSGTLEFTAAAPGTETITTT